MLKLPLFCDLAADKSADAQNHESHRCVLVKVCALYRPTYRHLVSFGNYVIPNDVQVRYGRQHPADECVSK
jgi:hypothetical protein